MATNAERADKDKAGAVSRIARIALLLAVACLALFVAANRIRLTASLEHFDPNNGDCLFWTEGAVQFRYARMIAGGDAIPARDAAIQWPGGIEPARQLCLLMERSVGASYREFGRLFGRVPFHVWAAYAPHVASALAVPAAYIAGLAIWGSAPAALLAAALYTLSLATTARSIGSFGHEDFALPFLFLAAAFLLRQMSGGDSGRRKWFASPSGAAAAAALGLGLGAWHFSRFVHLLFVGALALRIVSATGDSRRRAVRALAWITAGAAIAGLAFAVLRASAFLASPQMLLSAALLASFAIEARRGGAPSSAPDARARAGTSLIARRALIVAAIFAPLLLLSSRFSAESAGYGHVYALFADKLRFLGRKPADPSLLSPEARSLWIEDFASPSLHLTVVMFASPALLALAAILHRRARAGIEHAGAPDRAAGALDAFAVAALLALLSGGAFLLVKRLFVVHAFFLCVLAGGAALWAFGTRANANAATGPGTSGGARTARRVGRTVTRGATTRLRVVPLASICVLLAFEAHKITHHGGDTPVTAAIARVLKKPKALAIPNWHANDIAAVSWIRANTRPDDAFVARIGTSPMICVYGDRPIVLQPKYEVPGSRERARAFDAALYGSEADFYAFCREQNAAYYLHEPRAALEWGPDSERYVACATQLAKTSAAFRLQFAGEESRYFEPVYRSVSYCVYRVAAPGDTALSTTTSVAALRTRAVLPAQPIYDIRTFGAQSLDETTGTAFNDDMTAGVVAKTEESIALLVGGQGEFDARRLPQARALFERAYAINPSLIGLNTYLGLTIAMMGDYAAALPYCEREIAISPNLALAYTNLGFVEGNLGMYDAARAHLSRAIEMEPRDSGPKAMLEQVDAAASAAARTR